MAEHLYGTINMTGIVADTISPARVSTAGGRLRRWVDVVEVSAAAAIGSTYTFARLPSDCHLDCGLSTVHFDDLSTGATTLDIGDASNDDGLATDIDVNAGAGSALIAEAHPIEDYGKPLWQLLGYSADPGGTIDLVAKLAGAVASAGGTLVFRVYYTVD